MKRSNIFFLLSLLLITVACQQNVDRFTIDGVILEANEKTLYLDRVGADKTETIDSVKLNEEGRFSFSHPVTPDCFEFYRLRVDKQFINIAVDSTETISVYSALPSMAVSYRVEGSEQNSRLKDLVMEQIGMTQEINKLLQGFNGVEVGVMNATIMEKIDVFKTKIKNEYVLSNPGTPAAYYALFMTIRGNALFNAQADRQDAKCFAAVATQMDLHYPDAVRTKHIHNIALKGMSMTAPARPASAETVERLEQITSESGIIDIKLPDYRGVDQKLSDLKGQVVLLDFTLFNSDYSAAYNLMLRKLYDKFASSGFTIYQVSLDSNEHFWITGAANLPWTCVRDEKGANSTIAASYRISALPSAFLINKEGELVERLQAFEGLEEKIEKLLK
ncbi:MAG: AhpC/TSA family protein [Bacteroidaceae bacterium]|nr:AhpC/TSA family protein [Bacteroidaceae bacterium]